MRTWYQGLTPLANDGRPSGAFAKIDFATILNVHAYPQTDVHVDSMSDALIELTPDPLK